jgi:hypothetical protein
MVRGMMLAAMLVGVLTGDAAATVPDGGVDAGTTLSPQCEEVKQRYQQGLDRALQQREMEVKQGYPAQQSDSLIEFYRKAVVEAPARCERARAEMLAELAEQKAAEEQSQRQAEADIKRWGEEEDRAAAQRAKARATCTPPPGSRLRSADEALVCLGKAISIGGNTQMKTSEGFLILMKSDNGTGLFYHLDKRRRVCSAIVSAPEDDKLETSIRVFGAMARCGFGVDDKAVIAALTVGAGVSMVGKMYLAHGRSRSRHNLGIAYSAGESQEAQQLR